MTMPTAPTIDTTQSVLGYRAFERWAFQPVAFGTVTGWMCSALPPRLEFNPGTGKVSGHVETPGVYSFILTALNGTTPSPSVRFVFGIDGAINPARVGFPVLIDTKSKAVGLATVNAAGGTLAFFRPTSGPLIRLKHEDDVAFTVRLVTQSASGVVEAQTHDVISFKFALKSREDEVVILTADSFTHEIMGGESFYHMNFNLSSPLVDALMAEDTAQLVQAEFQWEIVNPYQSGPQILRQSSETFWVELSNDIIE